MKTELYNDNGTLVLTRNGIPLQCPNVNRMLVPVATKLIQDQGQVQLQIAPCTSACALFKITCGKKNNGIWQTCADNYYHFEEELPKLGTSVILEG